MTSERQARPCRRTATHRAPRLLPLQRHTWMTGWGVARGAWPSQLQAHAQSAPYSAVVEVQSAVCGTGRRPGRRRARLRRGAFAALHAEQAEQAANGRRRQ